MNNYYSFKVNELKHLLRQRGLDAHGQKQDLIRRLQTTQKCDICPRYNLNLIKCSKCKKNSCPTCYKACPTCKKGTCSTCIQKCSVSNYCSTIDCCNTRYLSKF